MSLGKSFITGLARLFGVSLVELASDREGAGRQLAEAAASAADDETIDDVFAERVSPAALDLDRRELEEAAEDSFELVAGAARPVDDSVDATDKALEVFAEHLDRDPEDVFWKPVKEIERLPDRPEDTYIWILKDGVDAAGYADQIDSMYREHFGRPARGLHVPVDDVEEIRLAPPAELRTYVEPHLKRAEQHEERAAELEDPASATSQGGD